MIARLKFLIPLILFSFGLHAQNSLKEYSLIVDSLYSVFNELGKPGCAIAIVKEGRVVYQKCFGLSDLEHQIPITSSTLFGLASVSKQFTGFGIAKLVKDQRLNLNFEIDKYLQNENSLWSSIQLRNLVHHTSGIWEWPYLFLATGHTFNDVITHRNIYKIIKSQSEVNFLTGSEFQYGSSNYVLLGQIISNVTDTCYFDWVKQNVFQQVGMSETTFQTSHSDLINNRAYGYLYENNKYSRTTDNISPQGTGSIYSNLTDLISWTKHILSEYIKKNPII
ncbi:MAG: serine hydrolase domain-containing protein, partial [Ignavibacteria bacterium]|nr:serine hydrolase domain-containing protein [Ignavibacteria bacterium]